MKGHVGFTSTASGNRPLSLSYMFLLDEPAQLILLNLTADTLNSPVMQQPAANGSTSLAKWRNHIKNVNAGPQAIKRKLKPAASVTNLQVVIFF